MAKRQVTQLGATRAVTNGLSRQPQAPNAGTRHLDAFNQPTSGITASVTNPLARKPR